MATKKDQVIRDSGRAQRHPTYRTSTNEIVPGGSTLAKVVSYSGADGLIKWAVNLEREGIDYDLYRKEAASFGTTFHAIVEAHGLGKPFLPENHVGCYVPPAQVMAKNFLDKLASLGLVMLENEIQVVSDQDRVGGTLDIVAGEEGSRVPSVLIDLKSSNSIGVSEMIQVCGVYNRLFQSKYGYEPSAIYLARADRNPPHAVTMYKPSQEQVQASLALSSLAREAWNYKKVMTGSIPVV